MESDGGVIAGLFNQHPYVSYDTVPYGMNSATFTWSGAHSDATDCQTPSVDGIAWCAPNNNNDDDYLQVNLPEVYVIKGVITFGRQNEDQWVKSYNLEYSLDGNTWITDGINNPLVGNLDRTASRTDFDAQIVAQYVKFTPITYNNNYPTGWKSVCHN